MLILTNENEVFDLTHVGTELKKDVSYSILDYTDTEESDYFWPPLSFLENFNCVAVELIIGSYIFQVPSEWSIVVGDPQTGDVEIVLVEELLLRNFNAFITNPFSSLIPSFAPIKVKDLYQDTRWVIPQLNKCHFLVAPLTMEANSPCILLINEKDQKKLQPLEMHHII